MVELAQAAPRGRAVVMTEPLPVASPLGGFWWTWVAPAALFVLSFTATWLLYRHFSRKGPGK